MIQVENLCWSCKYYIRGDHECEAEHYLESSSDCCYDKYVIECEDYKEVEDANN